MPVIKIKESESFEGAMKRFKKTCEKAGILTELRRREYYDKPSIRKKKKEAAARKRALKKITSFDELADIGCADAAGSTRGRI